MLSFSARWFFLFSPLLAFASSAKFGATAQERHANLAENLDKTMLGDWGGLRTQLLKKGITTTAQYTNDLLGNPVGGRHRGFANASSLGLDLNIKRNCLDYYASIVYRSGTSLSEKIDNQFPVAQVFGGENLRLNELYIRRTFPWGQIKLGRLDGGNDFLQSPLYYYYVSNAFDGNPIGIFFNVPFTAYPNSTWGAFALYNFNRHLSAKFAIFNANSKIKENRFHGLNFTFKNTDGLLLMTEWAYKPKGGNYRLGAYTATGNRPNVGDPRRRANWGAYILVDQIVYACGDATLTPWAAFLFSPNDLNVFPFFFTAGTVAKGWVAGKPKDATSFGIAYGRYSSKRPDQSYELVLELNHWIYLFEWFSITPDIQYIINPKGLGTVPNALVIGAQVEIVF